MSATWQVSLVLSIAESDTGPARDTIFKQEPATDGGPQAIVPPHYWQAARRIFGVYTMVNLAATTAGQMVLTLGDANGYFFFVLAAMIYCLALLPTAISATTTPQPLTSVSLNLRGLWENSPISLFAVLMVGVSNAAFGTLAAVYAARMRLPLGDIALFASVPILAGAALQIPVGIASDLFDRRLVLVVITVVAVLADAVFLFSGFADPIILMALSAIFGATAYSMYPVIVAHANDQAAPGTYIQVSAALAADQAELDSDR